jgi:pyruvate dehydrogenase E1 component
MAQTWQRERTTDRQEHDHWPAAVSGERLAVLESIRRRVLWLSAAIVHHANHGRANVDGVKVGGHQASSASVTSIMTALYFAYLRSGDRISVKPHASPVFHAIQYLLGNLDREYLPTLRAFHGLQAYPSRAKDPDGVHFSTGSVGLGAAAPAFAALAHRYAGYHFGPPTPRRFVSVMGDAELDEGNIWEAVYEDHLHSLGNVLWIVDLNRQSLDRVIPGIRAIQLEKMFEDNGWNVMEVKYGRRLQEVFAHPGGQTVRRRIDDMSNEEYQALIRLGGGELRERFVVGQGRDDIATAIAGISDEDLPSVIGDLGGHDLSELLRSFAAAEQQTNAPTVIFAYTIKGWGLPFAGDPLNHAALLSAEQFERLRGTLGVSADDWERFLPDSPEGRACAEAATRLREEPRSTPPASATIEVPVSIGSTPPARASSQEAFGRLMTDLRRVKGLGERVVTVSPDVAVSTNLGGWVNRVGVFAAEKKSISEISGSSVLRWEPDTTGQHIELGISEMNLFMLLGQLGLAEEVVGEHLLPIGTVYDPFILRGMDAFVYALYNGSKFVVVGTPSGVTLSPEGGAHQSTVTPGLGIELPNLISYEPCFAREVEWTLLEALRQCCDREHGQATYLRLSTRPIEQSLLEPALARYGEEQLRQQVLAGGYRLVDRRETAPGLAVEDVVQIAVAGAVVPEAVEAAEMLRGEGVAANVLALTSADRLFRAFQARRRAALGDPGQFREVGLFGRLIPADERRAPIVTVLDGASHALSFLGGIYGAPVIPLGVDEFGQSGSVSDLYQENAIDAESIAAAAMLALDVARG